ncbi:MAG: ribonuclease activity regulator RraA [Chloroflexi bacterium]|nr:ribonuclease activity regulator RraA [Chloroflexota bacterium]
MAEYRSLAPRTLDLLRGASTATLTSMLGKQGLRHQFMRGVRPLAPGSRLVGQAFTLRYIPAREDLDHTGATDNLTDPQRLAVEHVGPGDVLVIDARGDLRAGTLGAILATRMKVRGAAGIVTDGAFRDTPAIAASGLPAYCRGAHGNASKTVHHAADLQVPIGCSGVAVYPGDVIVGDDEGVVAIPRHLADAVAEVAAEQERHEEFIMERILAGASIVGTYPMDERTLVEYREWLRQRNA